MRNFAKIFAFALAAMMLLSACNPEPEANISVVSKVLLDNKDIYLVVGNAQTLTATVLPEDAPKRGVAWQSENTAVATVADGVVTAVAAGETRVIVTTDEGGFTAICNVIVTIDPVEVTGVTLDKAEEDLMVDGTVTLTATVAPQKATNKNITWISSDTSVATVADGVVAALAAGKATVMVITEDGGKTASCEVTVTAEYNEVTGVELDITNVELMVDDTATLTATVAPANATNKNITWVSSNENVATVVDGVVTALAVGRTTILVITEDGGKLAACEVTAIVPTYDVKVTAGWGGSATATIAGGAPATGILDGTQVTLTATVNNEYNFVKWSAAGVTLTSETANTVTFEMPANDVAVEAVFTYTGTIVAKAQMNYRITWDAETQRYAMTADPTNAGLYFKFGGVVGVYTANGAIQTLPANGNDGFDKGDVAWSPVEVTDSWTSIPLFDGAGVDRGKTITPESGYHSVEYVKAGKGDPCRLVGLDLDKIKTSNSLVYADIDNGLWRLPTADEVMAFAGRSDNAPFENHWTTLSGVEGGMFPTRTQGDASTFLPIIGYRNQNAGVVTYMNRSGHYWSSTNTDPNFSAMSGQYINFTSSMVYPFYYGGTANGFTVRCIRQ